MFPTNASSLQNGGKLPQITLPTGEKLEKQFLRELWCVTGWLSPEGGQDGADAGGAVGQHVHGPAVRSERVTHVAHHQLVPRTRVRVVHVHEACARRDRNTGQELVHILRVLHTSPSILTSTTTQVRWQSMTVPLTQSILIYF